MCNAIFHVTMCQDSTFFGIIAIIVVPLLIALIFGNQKTRTNTKGTFMFIGLILLVVGGFALFFEYAFESVLFPIVVIGLLISWALGIGSIFKK